MTPLTPMPTSSITAHSVALRLPAGEHMTIAHGALVAHSDGVVFDHCPESSIADGLRRIIAGSSAQARRLTWEDGDAWAELAGPGEDPSTVVAIELDGTDTSAVTIADGAWLANTGGIDMSTVWKGTKSLLARERMAMSRATGTGTLVLYNTGSLTMVDLEEGQRLHLGQGRLLAYTGGIEMDANTVASRTVVTVSGPGKVVYSSHSETS